MSRAARRHLAPGTSARRTKSLRLIVGGTLRGAIQDAADCRRPALVEFHLFEAVAVPHLNALEQAAEETDEVTRVAELFVAGALSWALGALAYGAVLFFLGERHVGDVVGTAVLLGVIWAVVVPTFYVPAALFATAVGLIHPLARAIYGSLLAVVPLTVLLSLLSGRPRFPSWIVEHRLFAVLFAVAGAIFLLGCVEVKDQTRSRDGADSA